jgi:putative MATE family efflux protein
MQVADTAIVGGRLGVASLAALGLSNVVYFFSTAVFSFLLVVTTPAVAAAEARGDRRASSEATSRALWAALGIGVLLAAALWVGAPSLLNALAPSPEAGAKVAAKLSSVAAAAVPHLRLRALGAPATLALLAANGAFRGHRDPKTPLIAGAAQIGVHLFLDAALLIFLPSLGAAGGGTVPSATLAHAAGAATTGAFVGAAVMVAALLRRDLLRVSDLQKVPSLESVLKMLVPGLPLAACIGAVAAAVLGMSAAAASLGAVALAAHAVVKQVVDFALAAFGTFSTVSQSLVAAALGANDPARARASVKRLATLGCGLGLGAAAAILAAAPRLPLLFTPDAAVGAAAAAVLPVVAALMPLAPAGAALEGALLGSMRVAHVGARTVAAAGVSLAVLHLLVKQGASGGVSPSAVSAAAAVSAVSSSASLPWWGGLTGVWIASASLLFFNAAADGALLVSSRSPLRGGEVVEVEVEEDERRR